MRVANICPILCLWLCLPLFALGCDKPTDDSGAAGAGGASPRLDSVPEDRRGEAFGVVPTTPTAEVTDNAVFFGIQDVGVVRLDDTGFKVFPTGSNQYFKRMWVGADGNPYAAGWGIHRLGVEGAEEAAAKAVTGNTILETGAVGPNGEIAAVAHATIYVKRGGKWAQHTQEDMGIKAGLGKDVAIDGAGNIWFLSSHGLWVLEVASDKFKAVWDTSTMPEGNRYFWDQIVFAPGNKMFVLGHRLGIYDGKTFELKDLDGSPSTSSMQLGPNNNLYIEAFSKALAIDAETFTPQLSFEVPDALGGHLNAMSVDGQGRVWLSTEVGLTVLDKDFKPTSFEPGTLPALSGNIQTVIAVGNGPTGLPTAGKIARGTIKGALAKAGKPLSGVAVELCPNPAYSFRVSPCEDAPGARTAVTADDGSFVFADIPLNAYGIAASVGGEWSATMGSECSGMQEGDVCDFGVLSID